MPEKERWHKNLTLILNLYLKQQMKWIKYIVLNLLATLAMMFPLNLNLLSKAYLGWKRWKLTTPPPAKIKTWKFYGDFKNY
jgi:hypothetical protein